MSDESLTKDQLRLKHRYGIEHLRCSLADDLRSYGVGRLLSDPVLEQLVARLYGSLLDSSLCRPEFRRFYGDTYGDPFPDGHSGAIPARRVRGGGSEAEPHIPTGYMERVKYVEHMEGDSAAYIASLPATAFRKGSERNP